MGHMMTLWLVLYLVSVVSVPYTTSTDFSQEGNLITKELHEDSSNTDDHGEHLENNLEDIVIEEDQYNHGEDRVSSLDVENEVKKDKRVDEAVKIEGMIDDTEIREYDDGGGDDGDVDLDDDYDDDNYDDDHDDDSNDDNDDDSDDDHDYEVDNDDGDDDDHADFLKKLKDLVASPPKPKGTHPCKNPIRGPYHRHRIAIVGAGIAGLHMAYLLKKKWYKNIVILEKDSRIGGKVMSKSHAGVIHEMGACYTSPDYHTSIYELAKEFGIDDFVAVEPGTVWLDSLFPYPLSFDQYVILQVMNITRTTDPQAAMQELKKAAYRYSLIHMEMFGSYPGELMYKPYPHVLERLTTTFQEFLVQNQLSALLPVLSVTHTMQGYGQLDSVSALYGLMWNTPNLMYHMLDRNILDDAPIKMFRNGFSQIIEKLKQGLEIRLNTRIELIKRTNKGVTITYNRDGQERTERFDFLIWAANAKDALNVMDVPAPNEELFTRLNSYWFSTTLFDSTEKKTSLTPVDYWVSNLQKKRDSTVWGRRDSRDVLLGNICHISKGDERRVSSVAYQFSVNSPLASNTIQDNFEKHFKLVGATDLNVVEAKTWDYFPHYKVEDMGEGILWKILENQGKQNTWYIGGSVCFDSTKSIVEYNKLLLRTMRSWKCRG